MTRAVEWNHDVENSKWKCMHFFICFDTWFGSILDCRFSVSRSRMERFNRIQTCSIRNPREVEKLRISGMFTKQEDRILDVFWIRARWVRGHTLQSLISHLLRREVNIVNIPNACPELPEKLLHRVKLYQYSWCSHILQQIRKASLIIQCKDCQWMIVQFGKPELCLVKKRPSRKWLQYPCWILLGSP